LTRSLAAQKQNGDCSTYLLQHCVGISDIKHHQSRRINGIDIPSLNDIVWVDYLIANPREVSLEEVRTWEINNDYALPEDFREIARKNQGRGPELPDEKAHQKTSLDVLFGIFHFEEKIRTGQTPGRRYGYFEESRPGALVFADWSGNYFAFDYGLDRHQKNPPIVYWDHETQETRKVADSFTDMLQKCLDDTLF